jgi:hypothetical protein
MATNGLLEHRYSYLVPSHSTRADGVVDLKLSTSGGSAPHPQFFSGAILYPRQTATMLQGVARIARTRFYVHPAATRALLIARDPVITASDGVLRFESLSPCAGVYARLDLHAGCLRGRFAGHGTTNVDFNPQMRAALGAVTDADSLRLSIGADAIELESGPTKVAERRVALAQRWVKSFAEVQLAQAKLELRHELDPTPVRRFLREVSATKTRGVPFWIVPSASGLRLSRQAGDGAVAIGGVDRLRALADLAGEARAVRIYGGARGVSAWELVLDEASFHFVLSPEASRGFSGEGGVLTALTDPAGEDAAQRIREELRRRTTLEVEALAEATSLDVAGVRAGLAVLGGAGLVGYDLRLGVHFHRELPFEPLSVESLHPRLRAAHKLIAQSAVRVVQRGEESAEALVASGGVEHRVHIVGDDMRCTCPSYGRHRGERGPCKHVLAVRLALAGSRAGAVSSV